MHADFTQIPLAIDSLLDNLESFVSEIYEDDYYSLFLSGLDNLEMNLRHHRLEIIPRYDYQMNQVKLNRRERIELILEKAKSVNLPKKQSHLLHQKCKNIYNDLINK